MNALNTFCELERRSNCGARSMAFIKTTSCTRCCTAGSTI